MQTATRVCEVPDCAAPARAYSMCWTHAGRFRRQGDPLKEGKRGGRPGPAPCEVPDPAPVRRLRAQLEYDRLQGRSFAWAWSHGLTAALGSLPAELRREWTDALHETREAWRRAYLDLPEPAQPFATLQMWPMDVEPFAVHRRGGAPVVTTGVRHDAPSQLQRAVVPWCN